jgi:DNA processing protein
LPFGLRARYLRVMDRLGFESTSGSADDDCDETAAWLALSRVATRGTRPWLAAALHAGSPLELVGATVTELRALGIPAKRGPESTPLPPSLEAMHSVIEQSRRSGIEVAPISSNRYPRLLRSLEDPPLFLFYRGVAPVLIEPCVAIVGSRRASPYGRHVATTAAGRLAAAGFWVVSGMALGIDGAAHRGALGRGRTAAVLAGGLDRPSPPSHSRLYREILGSGGALSEHPAGTASYPSHFPVRNRIITGLCPLVVVVEASERSGSLVSARLAAEQGRDVAAVPGNIDLAGSAGTNRLIHDGAIPLVDLGEIVDLATQAARRFGQRVEAPSEGLLSGEKSTVARVSDDESKRVLAALGSVPNHVDTIARTVRLDESRVMTLLTALELDGLAERLAEGTFVGTGDLTPR